MPSYSLLLSSFSNLETSNLKKKSHRISTHISSSLHLFRRSKQPLSERPPFWHTSFHDNSRGKQKRCNFFFSLPRFSLIARRLSESFAVTPSLWPLFSRSWRSRYCKDCTKKKEKKKRKRNSHGIFRTILTDLTLKSRRRVNVNGV